MRILFRDWRGAGDRARYPAVPAGLRKSIAKDGGRKGREAVPETTGPIVSALEALAYAGWIL